MTESSPATDTTRLQGLADTRMLGALLESLQRDYGECRSELKPEFRQRKAGGGWCKKPER
jgi:hypothetical protein